MTMQNEKFEELISDQLQRTLEPQRGRAAAAFTAQLAAEAAERQRAIAGGSASHAAWARKEVTGKSLLFWTAAPSLIAAALAVVVTLRVAGPSVQPGSVNPVGTVHSGGGLLAGGSPDASVAGMVPGSLVRQNVPPQPSGVVIVRDLQLQYDNQPTYNPAQWVDPVDHSYRLTGKP